VPLIAVIPEANFPEIFDFAGKLSCPESTSLRKKAAAWQREPQMRALNMGFLDSGL
jgi:hypothetical protein